MESKKKVITMEISFYFRYSENMSIEYLKLKDVEVLLYA